MIRFLPDTAADALLRPFAMAWPDAGIYVEISAPDLRLAAVVVLTAVIGLASLRRRATPAAGLKAVLAWLFLGYAVWMATSGNGRYFMAGLFLSGVACIALVASLPATRAFRLALAAVLVGLQAFLVVQASPFHAWGLAQWTQPPYFQVALDREAREQPATYVTLTTISYSLVAPQFPPESRWMNLSALVPVGRPSPDTESAQALLAKSERIRLFIPSKPGLMTADRMPTPALVDTMDEMLAGQRLSLARPLSCRFLDSNGLISGEYAGREISPQLRAQYGFWICAVDYNRVTHSPKPVPVLDASVAAVMSAVEKRCPRFFEPGQTTASRLPDGWLRAYPQSDMKLLVLDDGEVLYKYWRALNPVSLGRREQVLRGQFKVDCNAIRGRTGLPWEREI